MTIDHLRYFITAVKYLNFTRASDALFIHPTTMSRCIASMEEELGSPLFIRMKYSLQLTELGHQLWLDAVSIVDNYDRMMKKAKSAAAGITGRLSLLAPQLYYQMLADAYGRFYDMYPQVEFSVDVCPYSKMDTVCQAVLDRTVDMGITFSQNYHDDNSELQRLRIYTEVQRLTVPINHPLAGQESVKLRELQGIRLLIGDHVGKTTVQQILNKIDPHTNTVKIMHASAGETLLLQFTAGLGATIMPGLVAQNSGGNFSSIRIEDMDTTFDVLLVWRKDCNNPALGEFVRCLEENNAVLHPVISPPLWEQS